jgi:organic radical activating enzyme
MTLPIPDSFCLLPWIHTHVTAQGFRKLCCIDSARASEPGQPHSKSLAEFWNSEEMRDVRRQMLGGTLPSRCLHCSTSNRAISYKDDVLARWPDWVQKAIACTSADGSTALRPFSFDYRSSTCNLKCRTCGPHSSTASEIEARRSQALQELGESVVSWDEAYLARRQTAAKIAREELLAAARAGVVRHLYWAGGEPLLDDTHWTVMLALADSGQAGGVDIAYNTNLTSFSYRGRSVEELWPRFKSVFVQVSVDGLGDAGEYIRTGFRTSSFIRNVNRLSAILLKYSSISIALDLTLTSVGLLHLGDVLRFALDRRLPVTAKLMVPRPINAYMAVEFLPRDVKDDWCRKWMEWIEASGAEALLSRVHATLSVALARESLFTEFAAAHSAHHAAIGAFEASRRDEGKFRILLSVDERLRLAP